MGQQTLERTHREAIFKALYAGVHTCAHPHPTHAHTDTNLTPDLERISAWPWACDLLSTSSFHTVKINMIFSYLNKEIAVNVKMSQGTQLLKILFLQMATFHTSSCLHSILYRMVITYRSSSQSCSQSLSECFPILLHYFPPCVCGVIMCIHICKYECVCTCEGACRDQRLTWGIFSMAPHFIYWGRISHLKPELVIWFVRSNQPDYPFDVLPSAVITELLYLSFI